MITETSSPIINKCLAEAKSNNIKPIAIVLGLKPSKDIIESISRQYSEYILDKDTYLILDYGNNDDLLIITSGNNGSELHFAYELLDLDSSVLDIIEYDSINKRWIKGN
jgi:hypothetical protein